MVVADSMEILLPHENVGQVWGARDRPVSRATEHVWLTGPSVRRKPSLGRHSPAAAGSGSRESPHRCLSSSRTGVLE